MFYSIGLLSLTRQQFTTGFPFTNALTYTVPTSPYNPQALTLDTALNATATIGGVSKTRSEPSINTT
jgi:hypothetical protein